MNVLLMSLFLTFLASIVSLVLVSILLIFEKKIKQVSFHLVSFGAGALLATGFTDTLPEAVEKTSNAFFYTVLFIGLFFLIERVVLHFHHHQHDDMDTSKKIVPFLLFGDAMHNFIDGLSITATLLVSFPLGLVTTLAIFIHEIPHELGDFGILLHAGYKRNKVIGFNILTALTAFAGAILGYVIGLREELIGVLLALTTANFIYLSLADLLPEVNEKAKGNLLLHALPFFCGIAIMLVLTSFLKG